MPKENTPEVKPKKRGRPPRLQPDAAPKPQAKKTSLLIELLEEILTIVKTADSRK